MPSSRTSPTAISTSVSHSKVSKEPPRVCVFFFLNHTLAFAPSESLHLSMSRCLAGVSNTYFQVNRNDIDWNAEQVHVPPTTLGSRGDTPTPSPTSGVSQTLVHPQLARIRHCRYTSRLWYCRCRDHRRLSHQLKDTPAVEEASGYRSCPPGIP